MFQRTLAYYAARLYKQFSAYSARRLKAVGLNYGLLFFVIYVGKHPGCSPSELTEALHLDWGYSQRCIARLAEEGFLKKEKSPEDGRVSLLRLTKRGSEAFEISHQVFFNWDAEILAALLEEEQTALLALLEKAAKGAAACTT